MKLVNTTPQPSTACAMQSLTNRRGGLRANGFQPAFYDLDTGLVHPSRHADGRPADEHVLDGLPDEVVVVRVEGGKVIVARSTLVAGFERNGDFFTHASAWGEMGA